MKLSPKSESPIDLNHEAFTRPILIDAYRELAEQGELVDVTSWVQPEMALGGEPGRVQAMFTSELWKLLVSISPWAKRWQTTRGRGREVLWMASYALHLARSTGRQSYTFRAFLPTDEEEEGFYSLRVEYAANESGLPVVLIGLATPPIASA